VDGIAEQSGQIASPEKNLVVILRDRKAYRNVVR